MVNANRAILSAPSDVLVLPTGSAWRPLNFLLAAALSNLDWSVLTLVPKASSPILSVDSVSAAMPFAQNVPARLPPSAAPAAVALF